jgi:hypothetical protein
MRFRTRERLTYLLMFTTLGVGLAAVGYVSMNEDAQVWFNQADTADSESTATTAPVDTPPEATVRQPPADTRTLATRNRTSAPTTTQAAVASAPARKRSVASQTDADDPIETRPLKVRNGKTFGWGGRHPVFYRSTPGSRGRSHGIDNSLAGRARFLANRRNQGPFANVLYGDTIGRNRGPKVYTGPRTQQDRHRSRNRSNWDGAAYVVYRRSI